MHFFAGIAVALGCALAPWALATFPTRWIAIAASPFLAVVVAGLVIGIPIYPVSDLFVAAFGLAAGVALGRVVPPRFRPFFVLLLILSVLDVTQNAVFAGPSSSSTTSPAPGPHLTWLNFRFPLPGGRFYIGVAGLTLIAATAENIRRRGASMALSALPGVIGISLGEALVSTLPPNPPAFAGTVSASLVLFLTAGYVLTELAVSQTANKTTV